LRASFNTLGCRLNQLETEALASTFRSQGFFIGTWEDDADLYVINTCTVTSKSEQKARRMIRKISREHPSQPVIVTGCYAQMESGTLVELGENVSVIPLDDKDIIQDLAVYLAEEHPRDFLMRTRLWIQENLGLKQDPQKRFRFDPDEFSFHSRAYLKIQDGCDNQCAYCRVTLARGDSVSLDSDRVIERLNKLSAAGYREIVLTGVNIDSYQSGTLDLPGLFRRITEETQGFRIRLSSLDPQTITEDFCNAVAHERFCSYFHISLQSGSDEILQRMNRDYTAEQVLKALEGLREAKEDPFIAADVIAGFPGEKDEDFQNTLRLLHEGSFAWAHVFPYSSRPGTAAERMDRQVPHGVIHERALALRNFSSRARRHYAQAQLGKVQQILIEEVAEDFIRGLSSNYLNCRIEGAYPAQSRGSLIEAKALSLEKGLVRCISK